MNLVTNTTMHPQLRDEEALVVENAIRLAIDSIVNVLYGVNSARSREYQRMVADRDKEIERLEGRLTEIEDDLQVMRQRGCTCELLGNESSLVGSQSSGDRQQGEQSGYNQDCMDTELPAGRQQCEMSISLGLFARPPSHVSLQSLDAVLPSSPGRMGLDQTFTPHAIEASGVSEADINTPTSPSDIIIKDEPCDIDAVLIKWEMSEERFGEHQHKKLENREGQQFTENPQGDTGGHHITEAELLMNRNKRVPMSQLPEEAQRLKRAAWRAASKRYYARKVARQRASPSRSRPFHHLTDSQYSHPTSQMDKRKGMLISQLPQDAQALQREAWRISSRRYYARKIARHQTESMPQYEHLLQNVEASREPQGPNRGGSQSSSGGFGGILCS